MPNNMPKSLENTVSVNHFKRLIKKVALLIYRIPIRQSCKTVILSFSFLTDDFPC